MNTGEIDEIDVELVVVVWVRPGLRARSSLQPHAPFAATTSSLLLVIALPDDEPRAVHALCRRAAAEAAAWITPLMRGWGVAAIRVLHRPS